MTLLEAVLSTIKDLVEDDNHWRVKRDLLLKECSQNDEYEVALQEFISWFDEGTP